MTKQVHECGIEVVYFHPAGGQRKDETIVVLGYLRQRLIQAQRLDQVVLKLAHSHTPLRPRDRSNGEILGLLPSFRIPPQDRMGTA